MSNKHNAPSKLSVVGGGQLGMMLHNAAHKLNVTITVLDAPGASAHLAGANLVNGKINDAKAVRNLANAGGKTTPLTIEVEHVAIEELKKLENEGYQVHPRPDTMSLIADKLVQKNHLQKNKIPIADYTQIEKPSDIKLLLKKWEHGLIIKARTGGFDGRGNVVINNESDIKKESAKKLIADGNIYAEKKVKFKKELAVVLVRDTHNNVMVYPTVETIHKDNICHTVISPARVSAQIAHKAEEIGIKVIESFEGAGVFAVEMFLMSGGKIVVNEIAPRVHNSGHLTIEANETSQFENHVRAVTGRGLGSVSRLSPFAVMINILEGKGKHDPSIIKIGSHGYLHWYGKEGRMYPLPPRKIGHVTGLGNTYNEAMKAAKIAYNQAMEEII